MHNLGCRVIWHAEAEMRLVPWPSRLSPLQVRKAARLGDLLVDCGESQVGSWLVLAAGGVSAEADRLATGLQHCKRQVAENLWDFLRTSWTCKLHHRISYRGYGVFFAPCVLFWSFAIPWYPQNRCLEINLAAGAHLILSMVQPWQLGRKVLGCGWWKWEKL